MKTFKDMNEGLFKKKPTAKEIALKNNAPPFVNDKRTTLKPEPKDSERKEAAIGRKDAQDWKFS